MKRMIVIAVLGLVGMLQPAVAQITIGNTVRIDSVSASYKFDADQTLGNFWDEVSASKNFHLLDSASAVTLKSLKKNRWYAGMGSSVYSHKFFSVDFIAIRPLDTRSNLLPGFGASFQLGAFLYNEMRLVKVPTDYVTKIAPMIDGASLGVSYFRDFSTGENIPCLYGSLVARWGKGGK